ncbi:hypothetical protein CLOP_g16309 [Closterium sp. NIES-67]|nr:hypothetical protein CLOP_g16309 [Closterium sp. NIES-67]
MFERTDFDAVGPLFKEYFSITIEHSAGAVDYTSRLLDLASRLEARQTTLPPNLQIYLLLHRPSLAAVRHGAGEAGYHSPADRPPACPSSCSLLL